MKMQINVGKCSCDYLSVCVFRRAFDMIYFLLVSVGKK